MPLSIPPNRKRVRQRRIQVVKDALRAKQFTIEELTREAAQFIVFGLNFVNAKQVENNEYKTDI